MKICPKCNNENYKVSRFCRACGRNIRFTPTNAARKFIYEFSSLVFGIMIYANFIMWQLAYSTNWPGSPEDLQFNLTIAQYSFHLGIGILAYYGAKPTKYKILLLITFIGITFIPLATWVSYFLAGKGIIRSTEDLGKYTASRTRKKLNIPLLPPLEDLPGEQH